MDDPSFEGSSEARHFYLGSAGGWPDAFGMRFTPKISIDGARFYGSDPPSSLGLGEVLLSVAFDFTAWQWSGLFVDAALVDGGWISPVATLSHRGEDVVRIELSSFWEMSALLTGVAGLWEVSRVDDGTRWEALSHLAGVLRSRQVPDSVDPELFHLALSAGLRGRRALVR